MAKRYNNREVFIKDYLTGKVLNFKTNLEAADFLSVSNASIHNYLKKGKIVKLKYKLSSESNFPEIKDPIYEQNKQGNKFKTYVVVNRESSVKKYYDSLSNMAFLLGLTMASIRHYLNALNRERKGLTPTKHKRYDFYYYNEYKDINPKTDWKEIAKNIEEH